ncbi:MAG: 23S rRNA (guanine(2445)-N(2))/(guanine(2069)-N(7))-methyltransferase [Cellvibrionales bacterium TMED49]|nr:bifunctional 23S rRNA (guanine(2069)-N(7))-methyltransferase RlmK/23S rRNA (guanine(2445)-N(2))-methyltransferase RlmL [Porticoccaceae bacterium]OUU37345.1 MAG: 23S rRNA (guanine(2445)-N(2))/(guanine(2069)-N(7))-methyltransferase [Cellvibrionales bacterium TMED49]
MNQEKPEILCIASCSIGLEALLLDELRELGAINLKETISAVAFTGTLEVAYRCCLWSRLANRILYVVKFFSITSVDELYQNTFNIAWEQHFSPNESFSVDFRGTNKFLDNSLFGARRIKDAVVDRFKIMLGRRPSVDTKTPKLRLNVRLNKNRVQLSIDLAGESLHRRGYRLASGPAPLKENLAAALLLRSGWPEISMRGGGLIDPMCGGGTFLIEAAMIAGDIAPGLLRGKFGFEYWAFHEAPVWESLVSEAKARRVIGLKNLRSDIRGFDIDPKAIEATRLNLEACDLDKNIQIAARPIDQIDAVSKEKGLLITNPPYGKRLDDLNTLRPVYRKISSVLKQNFRGWRASVFTGNLELAREIDLSPSRQYKLYNASIPCKLLVFEDIRSKSEQIRTRLATPPLPRELGSDAQMLFNRLKKNRRKLNSWLKANSTNCYRLYDCDLPEYAIAIDVYKDMLLIQEYQLPSHLEEAKGALRFENALKVVKNCAIDWKYRVLYKQRVRQRGLRQYQKSDDQAPIILVVEEGSAKFEVNLTSYIDTGLFLDHRKLRARIASEIKGKSFLNLFCYTATASVQAALGGAESSLSCDMSNTYISWANRNMRLNNISTFAHRLLRVDCVQWLNSDRSINKSFDIILLDPPTFSNSKKMAKVFDIARNHEDLIIRCMQLLMPRGTLYFSTNFKKFKMSEEITRQFFVRDITNETIDYDFQRKPKMHRVCAIKNR